MQHDSLKKPGKWSRCLPQFLLLLFQSPRQRRDVYDDGSSNSKDKYSKLLVQPLRYILVFLTLLCHKIRNYVRWELDKPELFILKVIFLFSMWRIYKSLLPHLNDISHMDFDIGDQTEMLLLNSGFKKPKVEDLTMLSEYRVAFAGMVKNAESTLPDLIQQLEVLGCGFKYAHFFVLESNSDDHTREIIKNWADNPGDCQKIHASLTGMQAFLTGAAKTYMSQGHELELSRKHRIDSKSAARAENSENLQSMQNIGKFAEGGDIAAMQALQAAQKAGQKVGGAQQEAFENENVIFEPGVLEVTSYQPTQEFEAISQLMQRRETENYQEVREERYVVYRNFLLDKVVSFDKKYFEETGYHIDFLFWIDMDLRGFDVQMVAHEFSYAWRAGFDVVCANGVKYSGWYYDSYASVYEDGVWAYGNPRWRISNRIRSERFYEMKSCFGGLAAYSLPLLEESSCKYEHFGWAYAQVPSFARFADIYEISRTCEHLPINFCLREHGAKLAVASEAHTFYGTGDVHG